MTSKPLLRHLPLFFNIAIIAALAKSVRQSKCWENVLCDITLFLNSCLPPKLPDGSQNFSKTEVEIDIIALNSKINQGEN